MQQGSEQAPSQTSLVRNPAQPAEGAAARKPVDDGGATVSLVCGILSLLVPFVGLPLGIVAIVTGRHVRADAAHPNRGMAMAGFVCGIIGTVFGALGLIYLAVLIGGLIAFGT